VLCKTDINLANMGIGAIKYHDNGTGHKKKVVVRIGQRPIKEVLNLQGPAQIHVDDGNNMGNHHS